MQALCKHSSVYSCFNESMFLKQKRSPKQKDIISHIILFFPLDFDGSRHYVVIGDTARTHLTVVLPTGISIQATTVEKTVTFALALPAKYMVINGSFTNPMININLKINIITQHL